jgi:FkbM family methyltransferase
MTLRDALSENMKIRLRDLSAHIGVEIGSYTGSFADHRVRILGRGGVETVWDVGAHVGQYGARLRSHGYRGRLISIEPGHDAFAKLDQRSALDDDWLALSMAVSDCTGEATLHISENGQSSSLLPISHRHVAASPNSRYVAAEIVQTITLDEVRTRIASTPPYYMKLDLQGGELAALKGASNVLRDSIGCEVEISFAELYQGGASWQDVLEHLTTAGFILCDIERVFYEPSSYDLLQVNAMFRR